jgi:hypothetical protein
MSSHVAISSTAAIDLQSVSLGEVKARVRSELAGKLSWPSSLIHATMPFQDLSAVMDLDKLARVAATVNSGNELSFAVISREYIETGLNWIRAMRGLGLTNFIIIAGDKVTSEALDARGIANVLAVIDESEFDASYVSWTGFSAKGLAVSAFKFPVAQFLVRAGYSVVMSDADAVWLRDPMPYLREADVAFQRIVYHPPEIAMLWGFAACGGFISFRCGQKTAAFLERLMDENRLMFCDQVAMNLTLLEGDPVWHCADPGWALPVPGVAQDRDSLEAAFAKCVTSPIRGELRQGGVQVLALPHDKFWRHALFASPLQDMVVCHPNSPKNDLEKMKLLDSMGLRFPTGPTDLPLTR